MVGTARIVHVVDGHIADGDVGEAVVTLEFMYIFVIVSEMRQ